MTQSVPEFIIKPHQKIILFVTVILSIAIYLFLTLWAGIADVLNQINKINPINILFALLLTTTDIGCQFLRWRNYLEILGHPIHWLKNCLIYCSGLAFITTPGKSGVLIRGFFLKPEGVPYSESTAAYFAERATDLFAALFILILSFSTFKNSLFIIFIFSFLFFILMIFIQNLKGLLKLKQWFKCTIKNQKIKDFLLGLINVILNFRRCYQLPVLSFSILMGIMGWLVEGSAFYIILNAMNGHVEFITALYIYTFAMLIGSLSMLPGGLGSAEATMLGLLILNGTGEAVAVASIVLIRLTTLWFAVSIGFSALFMMLKKNFNPL